MSTLAEALKKAKRIELLLELDFGGLTKRYAMRDITVPYSAGDDKLFKGAILRPLTWGSSFDFRAFAYAGQDLQVEIANDERLQDEEARRQLDGGTGRVYAWAPGLDWADIETAGLLFSGIFEKTRHSLSTYVFTLRDMAGGRFTSLPETTISTDTWGDNVRDTGGGGSVLGDPQPLLFGDWPKGVPLKCVDTVAFKYLVHAGKSKATEAGYNAGTFDVYYYNGAVDNPGNYTFYPDGLDSQGNVAAYFVFIAERATFEPLSCSIQGLYDGSGGITGTAGELIEHPADVARYLMQHHSGLALDEIDVKSLKTMKSLLPNVKFATLINSPANGADVLDRLFRQCHAARISMGGRIGVVIPATGSPELARLRWDHHVIGRSAVITKTPADEVRNRIRTRYGINPTTGQYESELVRDHTNNGACRVSYHDYGDQAEYSFELPDVQEEVTAVALTNRLIDLKAARHDLVEIEVPYWDGIDWREGDAAVLSLREGSSRGGAGWSDEQCILLERRFQHRTIKQTWWRVNA